jgi:hypothetical protein
MSWRQVFCFWFLASALGGWLYFDARAPVAAPADDESAIAPLVAPPVDRFDEISIVRGSEKLSFRRDDGRWREVAPADVRVPSDLVAALLDTLSTIPPIERLGGESSSSPEFGLAPPEVRLELRGPSGTSLVVDIGRRNPTRTAAYAAVGGKADVYLIGLNAQYYLELIFDEVARQRSSREE